MMGTSIRTAVTVASGVLAVAGAAARELSRNLPGADSGVRGTVQAVPELVRAEVRRAVRELGLTSPAEVAELRHRVALLEGRLAADEEAGVLAAADTTPPAQKAAARKAAKKAGAKKTTAKRTAAKKATVPPPPVEEPPMVEEPPERVFTSETPETETPETEAPDTEAPPATPATVAERAAVRQPAEGESGG